MEGDGESVRSTLQIDILRRLRSSTRDPKLATNPLRCVRTSDGSCHWLLIPGVGKRPKDAELSMPCQFQGLLTAKQGTKSMVWWLAPQVYELRTTPMEKYEDEGFAGINSCFARMRRERCHSQLFIKKTSMNVRYPHEHRSYRICPQNLSLARTLSDSLQKACRRTVWSKCPIGRVFRT